MSRDTLRARGLLDLLTREGVPPAERLAATCTMVPLALKQVARAPQDGLERLDNTLEHDHVES
jgi:hypothetical protein